MIFISVDFCFIEILRVRGTGSADPTYLVRLLSDNHENVNELAGKYYPPAEFVDYKATKQRPLPMLYQSGYLTIKGYNARRNTYLLGRTGDRSLSPMTRSLEKIPPKGVILSDFICTFARHC